MGADFDNTREPGTIRFVGKDADRGVWWLTFDGRFGTQGFGGIFLKDGSPEDRAFRDELAAFFRVRWIHDAVGRHCFALRCFDINNEPIEGFEIDGERWTLTDFRRRHFPESEHSVSRLEQRKGSCLAEIAHCRRRIEEQEGMLQGLDAMFVDWCRKGDK